MRVEEVNGGKEDIYNTLNNKYKFKKESESRKDILTKVNSMCKRGKTWNGIEFGVV